VKPFTDAHCHAHEFSDAELEGFGDSFEVIIAVSDDLASSERTLDLSKRYAFLAPCVGVHPWALGGDDLHELAKRLEDLVRRGGVLCLGEVGLDLAFVPQTFEKQLEFFRMVLDIAKDYDLAVNVHAAKAWRQALEEVSAKGVRRALFHWYNGPLDVLSEIVARGYLISVNPTVRLSAKHLEIAKKVPLSALTFESDGPYDYRGLHLHPRLIPETVSLVAKERGLDESELLAVSKENIMKFLDLEY
jgi:TatD DNase family protein